MNKDQLKQYTWYIIVGICSMIMLVFFPMVGSTVSADWRLPTSTVEWIVWSVSKVSVSLLNMLIFHSFNMQGKVNIKDNEKYIQAMQILNKIKIKEYNPRSPKKFNAEVYGKKGTTLVISTFLALIAFSQALLTYDYTTLLTYLITLIMGIVFGVMQMLKTELYWTTEFYDYVLKLKGDDNNGN